MSDWISVKDKTSGNNVIVAVCGGDINSVGIMVSVGYYSPDYNCYCCVLEDGDFELCDIDYWHELPAPPK